MQQSGEWPSFAALLRWHRTNAGLTQEALAERAGLSRRGIADLERGARRAPHAHTVEQLAMALGLPAADHAALADAARHQRASMARSAVAPHQPEHPRLRVLPLSADEPDSAAALQAHHNLPSRPNPFVGRQTERARLATLVPSTPVVTLVGPGGVGKTRLALEVAADRVADWPDGVWLIELAALNEAKLVARSVAAVLGVPQRPGRELTAELIEWLRDKRLLLVLDNCEHVVDMCAQLASQVVRACPAVHLLATSREVLGIAGETVWRVDSLGVPAAAEASAETARASEAVSLFVDRAAAAAPGFRLTDANAPAVARICTQLDGLPLALELTAARLRLLSVEDVARRLDQRFQLLTGGRRDALPRHRTLRALVDWSYELLAVEERALFEQLSVFSGGWTLDAADAICTVGSGSTLDVLGQLIDKSLVQTEPQPDGSLRYRMLETLREYAAERLHAAGQDEVVQRRHALFHADALTKWWGPVWFGADIEARLARIAAEYPNIQASLRWLVDHGEAAAAQQLAASLTFFWHLRGRLEEGRGWLEEALALPDATPAAAAARAAAVVGLSGLETYGGNRAAALAALDSNLPLLRSSADAPTLAQALIGIGWLTCITRDDAPLGRAYLEEGLQVAQTARIPPLEALARRRLAVLAVGAGDDAQAERLLDVNRVLGLDDAWATTPGPTDRLLLLGIQVLRGEYAAAAAELEEIAGQYDASRSPHNPMVALTLLSWARLAQGDLDGAATAAVEALTIGRRHLGRNLTPGYLSAPLEAVAMVAAAAGDHPRALRLEAAAAAFRERDAILRHPTEQSRLERSLAPSWAALGRQAGATAEAAGRALTTEAAITEALAVRP